MQTPPPFNRPPEGQYYQPPVKPKKNPLVIVFAILGVLMLCCGVPLGAAFFYGKKFVQGGMGMISCYANASIMTKALEDYKKANDGKLPPAATWQTDIAKYFKEDKDMDKTPFAIWKPKGEWSCGTEGARTGFMFNADFGGKKADEVAKAHPETPVIFETKSVAFNQAGPYVKLKFEESPKLMDQFDELRGWILVLPEGKMGSYNKNGKFKSIGSGSGNGFDFDVDTEEGSNTPAVGEDSNKE